MIAPLYRRLRERAERYIHSDDAMAKAANTGALVVWSHQPFYPILVFWLVGRPVWPSFLLWLSLPVFFVVPMISTSHPTAARIVFAIAGVANTLLALKAFGFQSGAGWFLLPCLIVASLFFRFTEWKIAAPLAIACALVALSVRHVGPPLHEYTRQQYADLANLNAWCVGGLSLYLLFIAARQHLKAVPQARA